MSELPSKPHEFLSDLENKEESFDASDLPLKKRIFYGAMVRSFGNVTQSCQIAGIKRSTYRHWLKNDDDFRELINGGDFEDRLLDFAESKLIEKLSDKDIIAILFTLKTKGKRRGWIEGNNLPPSAGADKTPSWFDKVETEDAEIIEPKKLTDGNEGAGEVEQKTT
jgi:hypothetical protein